MLESKWRKIKMLCFFPGTVYVFKNGFGCHYIVCVIGIAINPINLVTRGPRVGGASGFTIINFFIFLFLIFVPNAVGGAGLAVCKKYYCRVPCKARRYQGKISFGNFAL
jgi:hypothetical protein